MGTFTPRLWQAKFEILAQSLSWAGNSSQDATGQWKSPSHPGKEQNAHGGRIGSGGFIEQENQFWINCHCQLLLPLQTLRWEQSLVKQNFWIQARFEGNFPSLLDPLERFWTVKILPVTGRCSQVPRQSQPQGAKPNHGSDGRGKTMQKTQFHLFPRVLSFSKLQHKQCQA